MKARVISTRRVVDVVKTTRTKIIHDYFGGQNNIEIVEYYDGKNRYTEKELEFDVNYDSDYWTRLEHQYAGMAMQGMIRRAYEAYCDDCANYENMIFEDAQALLKDHAEALADVCVEYAHALVEKYKKEK